ncbi:6,7-dimethyl-8-ribityllumazine synthase [Manganibacter manganicus]|uniref:6,7-dimethyl-8-ribityllumazine synthase n=1 Tax=Manganibacter manganicus TaxID=1873176 RepID=A0A1V8RS93_9HYPH|nr:6,7-dimethyl-8-ribityllumazine synthase [Pseudaminobacter manganicus]OQM75869.1 riboflavin synthase subunit beta [Pseudaminobacter manganicus]
MNQIDRKITPARIAFIQARWHADIVDEARKGFLDAMDERSDAGAPIDVFDVPGAFEIPLLARKLALSGNYAAIVGAAFVVDGGIYRHEFVAQTVVSALMQVQLETGIPVLSVVLTPHNFQETPAHRAFFLQHFDTKGREAASACVSVLDLYAGLPVAV